MEDLIKETIKSRVGVNNLNVTVIELDDIYKVYVIYNQISTDLDIPKNIKIDDFIELNGKINRFRELILKYKKNDERIKFHIADESNAISIAPYVDILKDIKRLRLLIALGAYADLKELGNIVNKLDKSGSVVNFLYSANKSKHMKKYVKDIGSIYIVIDAERGQRYFIVSATSGVYLTDSNAVIRRLS